MLTEFVMTPRKGITGEIKVAWKRQQWRVVRKIQTTREPWTAPEGLWLLAVIGYNSTSDLRVGPDVPQKLERDGNDRFFKDCIWKLILNQFRFLPGFCLLKSKVITSLFFSSSGQLIHSFLTCSVNGIPGVWMRFGSWFSSTCSMPIALLELMLAFLVACVSTQIPTQD